MNEPNYYIPPRGFTIPIGDGFTIYYYAIMIVCGIILATVVVALLFKRRNIPVDWVLDLLLCILPIGIVCARLFYCITGGVPIQYWLSFDEDHGIRAGGLSIIGGVMGGALGVVLFCVIHKINFLRVADCLVPGVILAQGIGRWGNFFNQEVYGAVVENTSLQWFPFSVYIEKVGEWHYAFFFYESVLNILVFALLFALMWNFKKKPHGLSLAGYLVGYGVVRSVMGVEVCVFLKEVEGGCVRGNLRSKGELDVSGIAQIFGGGGHTAAAGFTYHGTIEDTMFAAVPLLVELVGGDVSQLDLAR